jgi:hypothetical protein
MLFFAGGSFSSCCPPSFHQLGKSLSPADVSSPFFRAVLLTPLRFRFTHRAFAAAESFALVAADILFPPILNAERDKAVPRSEARRFSKVPIWRRIESASSNDLRDMSMSCG